MKSLRKIFILSLLIIFIMINTVSYGVEVTDESLKQAIEAFEQSDMNEESSSIEVSNNVITVTTGGEEYKLNYDLTGKPTFTYEVSISQGMSYDDFKEKTDALSGPMIGYIAVANIQGVELKDATTYLAMNMLGNAFQQMGSSGNKYTIYDDRNVDGNVQVQQGENVIKASEFGEHVMEYVNSLYSEPTTMNDAEGINSFEWTYEQKDVTETSCKIVSTLSVDLSADFTKLKGYADQMGGSDSGDIEIDGEDNETSIFDEDEEDDFSDVETITQNEENKVQSSTKDDDLPKTGISNTMYIIGAVVLISLILIVFKIHSYKDVK